MPVRPDSPETIGHAFARAADEYAETKAIIAADVTLTYRQLWRVTCGFAVSMEAHGAGPGSIVAIHSRDMIACIAATFAASLIDAGLVIMDRDVADSAVVTPSHVFRSPDAKPLPGVNYLMMDAGWPAAAKRENRFAPGDFAANPQTAQPWWYTHTSGTTGSPKFLSLSQEKFLARCVAMGEDFRAGRSTFCSLFPCSTRVFQVRAVAALLKGCTIVDTIDPAFMARHGVNILLGSPHTIMDWLAGRVLSPRITVGQVTGAKLNAGAIATLLKSFTVLEDVYGSSETSKSFKNVYAMAHGNITLRGERLDSEVVIDASAEAASAGAPHAGLVRVRNSYMADGYIDAPEATARMFRDGWFCSGDVGHFGPNGELMITGRADTVINLGGTKVNPVETEEIMASVEGVRAAFIGKDPFQQHPERLIGLIAVGEAAKAQEIAGLAMRACEKALQPHMLPKFILAVPFLPSAPDGAVKRRECEMLLEHALATTNLTQDKP